MSYGFKVMIAGDYACFTNPALKVERVSFDVPPPGALEGLLKSVYWKPSIRYVIDQIVVFHPINFVNIRRNEVKDKVSLQKMKSQMQYSNRAASQTSLFAPPDKTSGEGSDPCIYTAEERSQRASLVLKDVLYGVSFHFELTDLKNEREADAENKHYNILKRRLEKGQCFRTPCLGCSEFPVTSITLVDEFDFGAISPEILAMGDVDFGFMSYKVCFADKGIPKNGDWENPVFSDKAVTAYYRPHMVNGVIDVQKYREAMKC